MAGEYVTGFCNTGAHEGTRPKSPSGAPRPVCLAFESCTCDCHVQISRMYEMAGMERVAQDNPEYIPYKRDFWLPSDEPDYGLPEAKPDITSDGSVAVMEREVKVTETGRTQRGGLEFWVQRECLAWMVDRDPTHCTPRFLSEEIARVEGIAPPSQGAIAAVFSRWEKYGYAKIAHDRPQRFEGLTEQGEQMGLDWCRANYKKQAKA